MCQTGGSYDFPPTRQGNCYVWNLTGGIGDEVTQLIPKTKIPAHTRYALQCRFSPDSTCVRGLRGREPSDGFGRRGPVWGWGLDGLGLPGGKQGGIGLEWLMMTLLPTHTYP